MEGGAGKEKGHKRSSLGFLIDRRRRMPTSPDVRLDSIRGRGLVFSKNDKVLRMA